MENENENLSPRSATGMLSCTTLLMTTRPACKVSGTMTERRMDSATVGDGVDGDEGGENDWGDMEMVTSSPMVMLAVWLELIVTLVTVVLIRTGTGIGAGVGETVAFGVAPPPAREPKNKQKAKTSRRQGQFMSCIQAEQTHTHAHTRMVLNYNYCYGCDLLAQLPHTHTHGNA